MLAILLSVPHVVAGLATPESIVVPDNMLEGTGISVIVDEVTQVDHANKRVHLSDGRAARL